MRDAGVNVKATSPGVGVEVLAKNKGIGIEATKRTLESLPKEMSEQ